MALNWDPQKKNQNLVVGERATENKGILPSAVWGIFLRFQCYDDEQKHLGILFGSICYSQFLAKWWDMFAPIKNVGFVASSPRPEFRVGKFNNCWYKNSESGNNCLCKLADFYAIYLFY